MPDSHHDIWSGQTPVRSLEAPPTASKDVAPNLALPWVLRLRYGIVAGETAIILSMAYVFRVELPVLWTLAPLCAILATNLALGRPYRVSAPFPEKTLGAIFTLDTLCLTVILGLTGGPMNPFSLLYLVQITLSAVVLNKLWTWALGVLSAACFGQQALPNITSSGLLNSTCATPNSACAGGVVAGQGGVGGLPQANTAPIGSGSTLDIPTANYNAVVVTANGTYAGSTLNFDVGDNQGFYYQVVCARSDINLLEASEAVPNNQTRQWACPVWGSYSLIHRSSLPRPSRTSRELPIPARMSARLSLLSQSISQVQPQPS